MKGTLLTENGAAFEGEFAVPPAGRGVVGEVVFNTSMTGYQEIVTDPSYCNQIIAFTYPLVGNYGVDPSHSESVSVAAAGIVVRSLREERGKGTLAAFLAARGIPVLEGVDTRELVKEARERGTGKGWLLKGDKKTALRELGAVRDIPWKFERGKEAIAVSCRESWNHGNGKRRVAVVDFGCKRGIVDALAAHGNSVTVYPCGTPFREILDRRPDGILLSNGPGDPKDALSLTRDLPAALGKVPVMGICLGHQIIALHLGCDTSRLKYGHRGANHAVIEASSGKVFVTSQNHGYAVDESSLPRGVSVTLRNLNDGTVEGISSDRYPVLTAQFHPEANPGPRDSFGLFARFARMMDEGGVA